MTKMAAMPIYGKNTSKIFFSETIIPITLQLGIYVYTAWMNQTLQKDIHA